MVPYIINSMAHWYLDLKNNKYIVPTVIAYTLIGYAMEKTKF